MQFELSNNKDFWAGVMLIAIGIATVVIARDYPFGTTWRMGPGYFPSVLGGILTLFGLVLLARGLRCGEQIAGGWSLRALIILPTSFVLFGVLMDRAGFVPALVAVIFGSALASSEFRLGEVALLTVVLTVLCVAIFSFGLQMPYPLIVGF
ncbi:MAG TPA: tripartite tricarboxylate transporter TctB family protein [Xanthobacteraceae bacterium]|nr:tripartite tricarboxylate transporter TctB family protein [Xanthobacteraceae bacterium]